MKTPPSLLPPILKGQNSSLSRHSLLHPSSTRILALFGLLLFLSGGSSSLYAAYTPYYTDVLFTTIDTTYWYQNGIGGVSNGCGLSGDANGVALISKITPPSPSTDYDVKMNVYIFPYIASSGFTFVQYLRASNDALSGPAPQGSYYAVELQNPTFNGEVDLGIATLAIYKRVGGSGDSTGIHGCACRKAARWRL